MACNAGPDIIEDGLVLCLDAANINSYPKSGTTWSDLSGNGNHGALQNMDGANFSSDNRGSLTFDGTNEKVNCGNFLSDAQSALSICVWFKPSYVPSGAQSPFRLVSRFVGTGNIAGKVTLDTFDASGNGNGARFQVTTSNNTVYRASVGSVLEAKWLFYVGTFSQANSKIKIYKNAQELASTNTSGTIGAYDYPWTLGEDNTTISAQEWFDGNMASVSIYNRALTADEIRRNYEATVGRYT